MKDLTSTLAPKLSNRAVKPRRGQLTGALCASYREECSPFCLYQGIRLIELRNNRSLDVSSDIADRLKAVEISKGRIKVVSDSLAGGMTASLGRVPLRKDVLVLINCSW